MIRRTEAIVVASHNWRETSKVLTFYTRHFGKVKAIAKGVRRDKSQFGSSLELFTHLHLIFYERDNRDLQIVGQASTEESFQEMREDLRRLSYGCYLGELVDKGVRGKEESQDLFKLLLGAFHLFKNGYDLELTTRLFELRFLELLGYKPHLHRCVSCRRKIVDSSYSPGGQLRLSSSLGGSLCPDCHLRDREATPLSPAALSLMMYLQGIDLSKLNRLKVSPRSRQELKSVLYDYLLFRLEKRPKSLDFLEKNLQ
ncbi:DNA repair protein RecO [bacterium]|nr:DNA repair protein RecO [bacterium]MCK4326808.1 DNA repair protein RecO [bacterium]MCK4436861.1 DNA repair protein RecO [bacterium]